MHIPDNFLSLPVWATMDAITVPALGLMVRQAGRELEDTRIPLLGVMGAFVFAAQMINFPVGVGTSGHLVGGALLAVTLGPAPAVLVRRAAVVAARAPDLRARSSKPARPATVKSSSRSIPRPVRACRSLGSPAEQFTGRVEPQLTESSAEPEAYEVAQAIDPGVFGGTHPHDVARFELTGRGQVALALVAHGRLDLVMLGGDHGVRERVGP